jgi:chromosome segregation ATPase
MKAEIRKAGASVDYQPMSPDDMQRTMEFLLNQQAQFAADLQALTHRTDAVVTAVTGLTGMVGHVVTSLDRLAELQQQTQIELTETERQLRETDGRLRQTDERLRQTDERLRQTDERLRQTDGRINAVTDLFERHLRDDHGPRPS